jgi:hypothetical protein
LVLVVVGIVALAGALGGCVGDSSGATSATKPAPTTTLPKPGTAKISSFVVPASVDCGSLNNISVPVSWSTEGAKSQQIVVDGRPVDGTNLPSGSAEVVVHCDPVAHTVVIIAVDSKGGQTYKQSLLTTTLAPGR